ncbi:MAG TPA: glycosyltransferase family 1 protein [Acidimicrobiales bacterium]|nr:glycosyltransferase family 1 protein [Acidimicrobiales bacterium]
MGDDAQVVVVVEQLRRAVPGGIGTYARGLLGGLRQLPDGASPPVILHASATIERPDPLAGLGFPLLTSRLPDPLLVRAWDRGLCRLRRGGLVHACSLAAPCPGPPLVVTVHDLAWREEEPVGGRRLRWHEAALGRVGRWSSHVVVPSEQTAVALAESGHGIGRERISVIEEGADHLPAPDREAAAELLSRLGVSTAFLLAVGTIEPRKNLARLFEAYAQARPRLPEPWPLLVVGPAGWGSSPGALPEGVVLAGPVDAAVLAALYGDARCMVYVPLAEGFGLPVVEAMAGGTPVVSSDVPSAGGASLLVDPRSAEAIAEGILVAAADGPRREALRLAGRGRAGTLTWARAAADHVALWRRLIDAGT